MTRRLLLCSISTWWALNVAGAIQPGFSQLPANEHIPGSARHAHGLVMGSAGHVRRRACRCACRYAARTSFFFAVCAAHTAAAYPFPPRYALVLCAAGSAPFSHCMAHATPPRKQFAACRPTPRTTTTIPLLPRVAYASPPCAHHLLPATAKLPATHNTARNARHLLLYVLPPCLNAMPRTSS